MVHDIYTYYAVIPTGLVSFKVKVINLAVILAITKQFYKILLKAGKLNVSLTIQ